MQLFKAKIGYCKEIAPSYFKMAILADIEANPGQFFHIKCANDNTFRLRRPFSLHRKLEDGFEILFEKKGFGTEFLSNLKRGDILDIIGPCGNGFKIMKKQSIIIGGGIGIAPLFELALRCRNPKILIGAKTKDSLLCVDDFRKCKIEPLVSTDDGSLGYHGFITDLFLDSIDSIDFILYACGPSKMLDSVIKIAKEKNIPCQISVESIIACGVGACLGCAYKTKNGYKKVCKDGPVFDVSEL
ncbi:MAG: dihydroorotate dehydrogenase electron transfer subunit [bacterium]